MTISVPKMKESNNLKGVPRGTYKCKTPPSEGYDKIEISKDACACALTFV